MEKSVGLLAQGRAIILLNNLLIFKDWKIYQEIVENR